MPSSDIGTATLGMAVAHGLRRNRKTTKTTRMTLRMSATSTSWTDARMVWARSRATLTSMAGEIDSLRDGSSARM